MVVAVAIVASGAWCFGVGAQDDDELVLRVAMQDDIRTTNPLNAGGVWTWNVLGYLYDCPIYVDQDAGELKPYIAVGTANQSDPVAITDYIDWDDCSIGVFGYNPSESWDDPEKPEVTVFYDFTDVKWHDGHQMEIGDILFSYHVMAQMPHWAPFFNCLKDKGGATGSNFPNDHMIYVEKVWESDDSLQAALHFTLQIPYYNFFRVTLGVFLLPRHIWGTETGNQITETKIFSDVGYVPGAGDAWDIVRAVAWENPLPVGSGPFRWDSWDPTSGVSEIMTWRGHFFKEGWNPAYDPDELAHQPRIDSILFKIYKTSEAGVLALKNDDVDIIAWSIPQTFVGELSGEPGVAVMYTPQKGFSHLTYNMRCPSLGYDEEGIDVGKDLRRAIAHCIDKVRINHYFLFNSGLPGDGPICPTSEWYNSSIPQYDFDPEKAIEILSEAGYELTDGPGSIPGPGNWWLNPDGSAIGGGPGGKIELLGTYDDSAYSPRRTNKYLMIARQLQEIGLNVQAQIYDFSMLLDIIDGKRDPGEYEIFGLDWRIGGEPPDFLHSFFHSSNAEYGQNYPGYHNGSFDEIIDRARMSDDEEERKRLVFDAQAAIAYDLPYDVLYFKPNTEAYRSSNFVGWHVGNSGTIFNRRSVYKIHPPTGYKLNAQFVNLPSAVYSNSTITIEVIVKDQDRVPLEGAKILLNASGGSLGEEKVFTTASGKATVAYRAPYVEPNDDNMANGTTVVLQIIEATYSGPDGNEYDPAPCRLALFKVYPEGAKFLSVKMTAIPDVIDPDVDEDNNSGFTYIDVIVDDQNGDPAVGVMVACEVDPQIPSIVPRDDTDSDHTATDANGIATFILTSTDLPDNDNSVKEFNVLAKAISTDPDVSDGEQSLQIFIVDKFHCSETPPFDGGQVTIYLTGCAITVLVGMVIVWRWRKK